RAPRWTRPSPVVYARTGCSWPVACGRTPSRTSCAASGRSRWTWPRASSGRRESRTMKRSSASSAPRRLPDAQGHFGEFGGRYVAETLMPALLELEQAWAKLRRDARFRREFHGWLRDYAGRPTRLYFARRLSERLGGARIYLKREDLLHTGAHKVNNTIGQALVARRLPHTPVLAGGPRARPRGGVGGLRGRRGRAAPEPERLPHEAPRPRGAGRRGGLADAQGRDERGAARL